MAKTTAKDMTSGNIPILLLQFAIPLLIGNLFQMLYNLVDSIVVGNFVGKEALAAVGATTMIVNMFIFFFNGFSVGAGVVISRYFGAKDIDGLHRAIETTMFFTFVFGLFATVVGIILVPQMLIFMKTPLDVMDTATVYLRVYFAGISGLMIYNMGSGILRAVGDTKRPLFFLIFTSIVNVVLDLLFVIAFDLKVAGVALATIIAQFISASLIIMLLVRTKDIYHFSFRELKCEWKILFDIFKIGLPSGIQSVVTSFSNIFVQGYINHFGSACMAGWSCYNKLDSLVFLPIQSISSAATTFVGQNVGAKKIDRVNRGTVQALLIVESVTAVITTFLFIFAEPATRLFIQDTDVIEFGVMFIRTDVMFLLFNCVNHTLAGALRGRGDSTGPMIILLSSFVGVRQIYLYVVTHYISNTAKLVGFSYPVGWMVCFVIEITYLYFRWLRKKQ
ncbi:MAG: MATE family efflux transporter [Clostridia bacterium]|nr:MATE family efflux transporter [Clostridia bacterium]